MARGSTPRLALTYGNDRFQDGAGSQLVRIYGVYAISRHLGIPYVHSPLARLDYQGLSALENNAPTGGLLTEYNRVFHIPSDIELPEAVITHEMRDADVASIEQIRNVAHDDFHLIRIVLPFPCTEGDPELFRCVKAISPFPYRRSDVFRVAIHVRRGELFAIDSHRMLPNSYYLAAAMRLQKILKKLDIPFVCELYTEVASRRFEVTPQHHGMAGLLFSTVTIDPAMNQLEDFDAIPNLQRFINTDPIEAIGRMATADALILSHSCFSYLPAILSQNCVVIYHPFWHSPMKDWLIAGEDGRLPESRVIERLKAWKRAASGTEKWRGNPETMRISPIDFFETTRPTTGPRIESLLEPFRAQSAMVRSMVVAGDARPDALLLRLDPGVAQEVIRVASYGHRADWLASLAGQAGAISTAAGDDLLLVPAEILDEQMPQVADDFRFRAVAAVLPEVPDPLMGEGAWRLRRSLFDRGLVCIGAVPIAGSTALCFLASDAVHSFDRLDVESRGHITMASLAEDAGFANQLFRYSAVKLYAIRHGLTLAVPEWQGSQLFGLHDPSCEGFVLPGISYPGFADNDRELWDRDDPPIDFDLHGYFQEIPECWRKHRPLLRNLFALPPAQRAAIDNWQRSVTDGGRRPLVAIHVRRGDYRRLQNRTTPWFRIVPEEWYLDWLRGIWPTLRDPVLFVATDEPDAIVPVFEEFHPIPAPPGSAGASLRDDVCDFEILRRANYLAICNSSYSHMAAILAPSTQKCFIPSFQKQSFQPYEPWITPAFWAPFADSWKVEQVDNNRLTWPALGQTSTSNEPSGTASIFFDVSDLVLYLLHHTTLTGIQRVQGEILRNLPEMDRRKPVRFVVLNQRGGLFTIDESALLTLIEDVCSGTMPKEDAEYELRAMLDLAVPCAVCEGDTFLEIGAFWNVRGMGVLLQNLKNSGVQIGVFIHDIIPIEAPEYFEQASTSLFVKAVVEALTFADFILTTSEYNKASLSGHMAGRFDPIPIHLVPLGHEFSCSTPDESEVSTTVADILEQEYVLCVGTLEVRKNPAYLLNVWKMMTRSGRPDVPYLVFAGRQGWLVGDFMRQLEACNYLGGRIVVLHGATDVELDLLYQNCILTMFPSFVEGWGLPVGESLAHGKICLCSAAGGIPEAGGKLVDYLDPYNARDGLQVVLRYLDDPELRTRREREIAGNFKPRSWREVADTVLGSTHAMASHARLRESSAVIPLPPDRYMPISNEPLAVLIDEMDGRLSAELSCVSGWRPPDVGGVRAAQPVSIIRFRAEAPAGTRINLVLRLAATGRDFRVRIRSGSGAETDVQVLDGSEKMAALSCAVEEGNLVTAHLLSIGAMLAGEEFPESCYWTLKGILYFDPRGAGNPAGDVAQTLVSAAPRLASTRLISALFGPPPFHAPVDESEPAPHGSRLLLRPTTTDGIRRAPSLGAFLEMPNSYWPSDFVSERKEPIFADAADRQAFYSSCGTGAQAPQVGPVNDGIKFVRRSGPFVSMSRFSEGSVFDRSGVWRACGYLQGAPVEHTPWLSHGVDGMEVDQEFLAQAPYLDGSYLVFYNGNLHNYYHWLVEGLLGLDILTRAMGPGANLKIALPKSMDINALLDHRESLPAIGLGDRDIVEIGANLIRVQEAIWIESDLVQTIPKPYLKDFQQRISSLYADLRGKRRRLLVARRGPTRMIHNLGQVEAFLSAHGFETVYLEEMSMRDQILLFQSAELLISPHGAGLANLLFCEPGTKVIELMPVVELRPFFWQISQKLDLVHAMQFCAPVGVPEFQSAIHVDIGKLHALIKRFETRAAD